MVLPLAARSCARPLAQFGDGAQNPHQDLHLRLSLPMVSFASLRAASARGFGQMIALLVGGEGAALDVFAIVFDGGADQRAGVGVAADEFGRRRKGEADQIVEDENLAVAIRTGADADGGNGQLGGDGGGHFAGNAFKNDCASAGIGQSEGSAWSCEHSIGGAGLHAIAAHAVHALRGQAEMADHGNLGLGQGADQLHARAFDLDGFRARFLDESDGVGNALGNGAVIAAERHVGHHQSAAHGATHGARVVQHLVHGNGQRVFMAEHDHGQRVADKNQIDAGLVDEARGCVVVGG